MVTGDACQVSNGPLAGKSLAELRHIMVGSSSACSRDPNRFPLLLKFLFPQEKLSVQVLPMMSSRRVGEPWGKTECWYVVHATRGADRAGLKAGTTRESRESISREPTEDLLHWINIYAAKLITFPPGRYTPLAQAPSAGNSAASDQPTAYMITAAARIAPRTRFGSGKRKVASGKSN